MVGKMLGEEVVVVVLGLRGFRKRGGMSKTYRLTK